jgi:hypothetical protein
VFDFYVKTGGWFHCSGCWYDMKCSSLCTVCTERERERGEGGEGEMGERYRESSRWCGFACLVHGAELAQENSLSHCG